MTIGTIRSALADRPGLARQLTRRHDARLADAIIDGVATGCPFPAVIGFTPDLDLFRVRIPGVTIASVSGHELRDRSELAAMMLIIRRALDGYAALEPIPHDHPLGQD